MAFEHLNKAERFAYEWQYGTLGGFNQQLALLIAKADVNNTDKLRQVFPDEVEGVYNYQNTEGYWENVLEKVKRSETE